MAFPVVEKADKDFYKLLTPEQFKELVTIFKILGIENNFTKKPKS